jgi:hypothetical protein
MPRVICTLASGRTSEANVKVSGAVAGAMVVMALLFGTDDPGAGCRFLVLRLRRFVSLIGLLVLGPACWAATDLSMENMTLLHTRRCHESQPRRERGVSGEAAVYAA